MNNNFWNIYSSCINAIFMVHTLNYVLVNAYTSVVSDFMVILRLITFL